MIVSSCKKALALMLLLMQAKFLASINDIYLELEAYKWTIVKMQKINNSLKMHTNFIFHSNDQISIVLPWYSNLIFSSKERDFILDFFNNVWSNFKKHSRWNITEYIFHLIFLALYHLKNNTKFTLKWLEVQTYGLLGLHV